VESSNPVDIFVVLQSQEPLVSSVALATQHGLYCLPQRKVENQTLTLPDAWKALVWSLVIANPNPTPAAITYNVFLA
jgi:hypothetical protein